LISLLFSFHSAKFKGMLFNVCKDDQDNKASVRTFLEVRKSELFFEVR